MSRKRERQRGEERERREDEKACTTKNRQSDEYCSNNNCMR